MPQPSNISIEIKILSRIEIDILRHVASGVFDHPINPRLSDEFLNDPRHHLAVAIDSKMVIGMASGVHYVHPDKEPQLFINEVAVNPAYQKRGIGKRLVDALLRVGQDLGCTEAWVLTDRSNAPAMRLYASCGGAEAANDPVMFTFKFFAHR